MKELPFKFKERMIELLGKEEYALFEDSILNKSNIRGLRVNTKKISVEKFLKINPYKLEKLSFNNDGFILKDDEVQMGGEVFHQAGMFYMQDPSAMIPINSIQIKKDWRVLDLCAAPGGKTSQISNQLSDGFVIANDIKFDRCKALVFNIERLGLENVIITSSDCTSLCKNFKNYFDMVLIDATCSGEGMFRKNPNLISTWSEKNIKRCCDIQKSLLSDASKTLKKNGILVYSTCTFSLEENEQMICEFLANNSFELLSVNKDVEKVTVSGYTVNKDYDCSKMRRCYPHMNVGEGQFVAVMKKIESDGEERNNFNKNKSFIPDIVFDFLNDVEVKIEKERLFNKSNKIWILPKPDLILKNNVVSYGVKLGTIDNNKFTPDHAFFMTFGNQFKNKIDLETDNYRLKLYLEGKSIKVPIKNGYGVIQVEGCTLGGFYAKNNILTSLYPSNLTNKDIFNKL